MVTERVDGIFIRDAHYLAFLLDPRRVNDGQALHQLHNKRGRDYLVEYGELLGFNDEQMEIVATEFRDFREKQNNFSSR
jgi:hypothetical protein